MIRYLSIMAAIFFIFPDDNFAQPYLEQYLREGIANNDAINQQVIMLEKSVYALKEAKTLFLPNVTFNSNYSLAGGGRTIDFPLGDLLNNTYSTLNQLTNSNNFPQLQNQHILLNPNNFYDAKFRTSLPIFNLEIEYNRRVKTQQVTLQQIEVDLYKRELVKEIKTAYFKYLQAKEAIKIYDQGLELVKENLRISKVLFNNDKVNGTSISRTQSELSKFESLVEVAKQNALSARSLFNFLINRGLSVQISEDSIYNIPNANILSDTTLAQREELKKLRTTAEINKQAVALTKSYIVPKLSTFMDLGSQGFEGKFNDKTRYYLFGLSLQWDLFSFGKNSYRVKQAELDTKAIEAQTSHIQSQLRLQLNTSINSFHSSLAQYRAAVSQLSSSEKYYRDVLKLYREGLSLYIELLDAQNQLVSARLQRSISLYDTWIKAGEVERYNSSFNLK